MCSCILRTLIGSGWRSVDVGLTFSIPDRSGSCHGNETTTKTKKPIDVRYAGGPTFAPMGTEGVQNNAVLQFQHVFSSGALAPDWPISAWQRNRQGNYRRSVFPTPRLPVSKCFGRRVGTCRSASPLRDWSLRLRSTLRLILMALTFCSVLWNPLPGVTEISLGCTLRLLARRVIDVSAGFSDLPLDADRPRFFPVSLPSAGAAD
mmetsp:Transcript_7266/g.12437  ORF Transcript_7266/g.12437 Transcript_7266/m.12437 type:complete len:205 (-) Transcript_7266:1719-2333(-)